MGRYKIIRQIEVGEHMKKILTIAGSDSSGGAGIQADIKTITAHKMYGMTVITALTAQNTTGVYGIMEVSPEMVSKQIDSVFQDIRPDAVKIGMVFSKEIIEVVAKKLKAYKVENLVIDPVMVATSGAKLLSEHAQEIFIRDLLPMAKVITPNLLEAQVLSSMDIKTKDDMVKSGKIIFSKLQIPVLLKGGHLKGDAIDLLYEADQIRWFKSSRIDTPNTHGTGCTLSSAIACNLAMGKTLIEGIEDSKKYLSGALSSGLDLGKGSGPLNHMFAL